MGHREQVGDDQDRSEEGADADGAGPSEAEGDEPETDVDVTEDDPIEALTEVLRDVFLFRELSAPELLCVAPYLEEVAAVVRATSEHVSPRLIECYPSHPSAVLRKLRGIP